LWKGNSVKTWYLPARFHLVNIDDHQRDSSEVVQQFIDVKADGCAASSLNLTPYRRQARGLPRPAREVDNWKKKGRFYPRHDLFQLTYQIIAVEKFES
jgi:hypothetical protein